MLYMDTDNKITFMQNTYGDIFFTWKHTSYNNAQRLYKHKLKLQQGLKKSYFIYTRWMVYVPPA